MVSFSLIGKKAHTEFSTEISKKVYRNASVSPYGVLKKEELEIFDQIIHRLATDSIWSLMLKASEVKKLGRQVAHIHPLNFIEALQENPALKASFISIIERGGVVCKEYLKKLEESLEEQAALGNITPYLEHFSDKVRLTSKMAKNLFGDDLPSCNYLSSLFL